MPKEDGFVEEWEGEEGGAGEMTQGTAGKDPRPAGEGAPSTAAGAPAETEAKEIMAPETVPAVEQAGAKSPLDKGQAVLPEEGGTPVIIEPVSVQWSEEALAAGPAEKGAEKAVAPPQRTAEKELTRPPGPVEKPGPLYPYFAPLPPQFRGTLTDVRRFIGIGELMLLSGGLAFLAFSLAGFGTAVVDTRLPWTAPHVADDFMWGILGIILSAGSFSCLVLSRRKLRGAFLRNDFPALHRRLVLACAAGLVLGLFVAGVFFFLAYVKVDELPQVQAGRSPKKPKMAVQRSS